MTDTIAGKVIVITGASSGMGAAAASQGRPSPSTAAKPSTR